MKWNNIKITIFKELRGIIRDKKSLRKLILYPLLIPLVILLFGFMFDSINESTYKVGINYSLNTEEKEIVKDMDNIEFKKYNDKKELEKAYNNGDISGYIIKKDNKYTIYSDVSQNSGETILALSESYLDSYNKILGINYLTNNNINPNDVFNSITINEESLNKNEDSNIMTGIVFSMVMTYLIMIVVMVCVVVVTDATSGEKERGTLETILTFPIKSSELVFGKYLATSILSFIIGTIAYLLAIPVLSLSKNIFTSYGDIVFMTNISTVLLVIFVIFLSALLSSGVCMALAGKAKTYKEAQSSLQFITLLPMIPYFLSIMEVDNFIFNLIPIANCGGALNDIVAKTIDTKTLLTIIVTTIIYTIVILFYISKQYKKEETLFS